MTQTPTDGGGPGPGTEQSPPQDDDVVDAEIVDDDKDAKDTP